MNISGKLLPLLLYLFFMCSVAHSEVPKKEQFDFLSHYNNASLVESSLKLTAITTGLAASTLLNYGFWYSICESPNLVSALAGRFDLSTAEEFEVRHYKLSFCNCNQLAAAITATEVALAGHVSPWPVERAWWQPLRFTLLGAGSFIRYKTISKHKRHTVPLVTLAIFSGEIVSRTVAGTLITQALRYQNKVTISPLQYAYGEKLSLSSLTGVVVGTIIYEAMIARGFRPAKAAFAYAVSATLTGIISAIISLPALYPDMVGVGAVALVAPAVARLFGIKTTAAFTTIAGAAPGMLLGVAGEVGTLAGVRNGVAFGLGAGAGTWVFRSLMSLISKLDMSLSSQLNSKDILKNLAIILIAALDLALINGFSNNAVYGTSLEESLMETAWNQWKKFYAPLDYLHALFN
ncbi:hypothetical protein [Endozoicomonas sp. 8E]|uniref:hypothetical protein n=1 Tax=Endozoicomonas sp. 8E TaxID=3035692 RepID=UPI0029391971|nr:hypothetical protein [Endozoicomonas sp. 8E]WOG28783.1 hypothetical protein P6910_03755 [Endozoicomonas sp. 8E]